MGCFTSSLRQPSSSPESYNPYTRWHCCKCNFINSLARAECSKCSHILCVTCAPLTAEYAKPAKSARISVLKRKGRKE